MKLIRKYMKIFILVITLISGFAHAKDWGVVVDFTLGGNNSHLLAQAGVGIGLNDFELLVVSGSLTERSEMCWVQCELEYESYEYTGLKYSKQLVKIANGSLIYGIGINQVQENKRDDCESLGVSCFNKREYLSFPVSVSYQSSWHLKFSFEHIFSDYRGDTIFTVSLPLRF